MLKALHSAELFGCHPNIFTKHLDKARCAQANGFHNLTDRFSVWNCPKALEGIVNCRVSFTGYAQTP